MENSMEVPLKKLKIELLYDTVIPLLGIYLEKKWKHKFRTIQHYLRWSRHRNNSSAHLQKIGLWSCGRDTHTHTQNGLLLSHKKEWNIAICSNMDGPRDYHAKWVRQGNTNVISLTYEI